MPTLPPSMTPAPATPDRGDRSTFVIRAVALDDWRKNFNVPEMVAALINVFNNAVIAFNSAVSAATSADTATAQAGLATINGAAQVALATAQANAASASAVSAVNAPGTSATSTTSITVGLGSQSLTIQTGKSLVDGMNVVIARTSDPVLTRMSGIISAYNSVTGDLSVSVGKKLGAGTFTDWTISLSGEDGIAGTTAAPIYKNAAFTATSGSAYNTDMSVSGFLATLPGSPALGDSIIFIDCMNVWAINPLTIARNGYGMLDPTGASVAEDLVCDVSGLQITLFFNGTNWMLI